jgi:hypothetical protein
MLSWLRDLWHRAENLGESALSGAASLATGAIAAVLGVLTGNVFAAWQQLEQALRDMETIAGAWTSEITTGVIRLITYDIPHYAMTAWWWVTHPAQLAESLFWHIIRQLEDRAWQAAEYLGEFALALVLRNARRLVLLAEHIITAIL